MKRIILVILIVLLAALLSACGDANPIFPNVTRVPTKSPTPTPAPTETPAPTFIPYETYVTNLNVFSRQYDRLVSQMDTVDKKSTEYISLSMRASDLQLKMLSYISLYNNGYVLDAPTPSPVPTAQPYSAYAALDYTAVERNPENYAGVHVQFSGNVIQVVEDTSTTAYRIATSGSYDNVVYVLYTRSSGEQRVLEDDYVTVYGMCTGVVTYQSTGSGNITIPSFLATKIDIH